MDNNQNLHRFYRYYTVLEPWLSKPKARGYGFLILSIFTSAFFLFFAVRPTINTIINLRKQISDSTEVDRKLTEKINSLSQLQAQYEVIKADLPFLVQVIPTRADVAALVRQMENVSKDNQLTLTAVQFGDVSLVGEGKTDAVTINALPVRYQITEAGGYPQILTFLNNIKKLPRLISIESVDINAGPASPAATIRLKAYYYKQTAGSSTGISQ